MSIHWLTGLSGSGKTTLAKAIAKLNPTVIILDSDDIRISMDFTLKGKLDNAKFLEKLAIVLNKQGFDVIVACIQNAPNEDFIEVYVSTPLSICRERDAKGLYALNDVGKITNFTGGDILYMPPTNPNITIDTSKNNDIKSMFHRTMANPKTA